MWAYGKQMLDITRAEEGRKLDRARCSFDAGECLVTCGCCIPVTRSHRESRQPGSASRSPPAVVKLVRRAQVWSRQSRSGYASPSGCFGILRGRVRVPSEYLGMGHCVGAQLGTCPGTKRCYLQLQSPWQHGLSATDARKSTSGIKLAMKALRRGNRNALASSPALNSADRGMEFTRSGRETLLFSPRTIKSHVKSYTTV